MGKFTRLRSDMAPLPVWGAGALLLEIMPLPRPWLSIPCLTALLSASCSTGSLPNRNTTELHPQANDSITGSGKLVMSAVRATAVASIRQPVTTIKLGLVNLWHRPREVIGGNFPSSLTSQPLTAEIPGTPEFEGLLDRKGYPSAQSGKLEWLVDGPRFFPELDRRIAAAKQSIDVQIYIFDNDDIATRVADRLKARSGEVKTRVLFDDMGSTFSHTDPPETPCPPGFVPPVDMKDYLKKDSKVHVRRILNPWLCADHTKLLVFDHDTAIVGGMNIGREYYSEWHDLMFRVEGPVVATLSREFNRAWRKAGPGGDFGLFRKPVRFRHVEPLADGGIPLRVLRTDAAEGRYEILDSLILAIRGARQRVWIESPYFASDEIAAACEAAARRGVDVRIILPQVGDSTIMDTGNLATARGLIGAGAKVYRYPRMTHMKIAICDNWASVGSANLDTLSMRINRELNLAFSDRKTIRSLEQAVFDPDFRASRLISLKETESALSGLAESLADQL